MFYKYVLLVCLQGDRNADDGFTQAEGRTMSPGRLVRIAADTARGLNYLHACQVRDVAS